MYPHWLSKRTYSVTGPRTMRIRRLRPPASCSDRTLSRNGLTSGPVGAAVPGLPALELLHIGVVVVQRLQAAACRGVWWSRNHCGSRCARSSSFEPPISGISVRGTRTSASCSGTFACFENRGIGHPVALHEHVRRVVGVDEPWRSRLWSPHSPRSVRVIRIVVSSSLGACSIREITGRVKIYLAWTMRRVDDA